MFFDFFWKIIAKYRLWKNKEDAKCINEKFGIADKKSVEKLLEYKKRCKDKNLQEKIVWIHSVSVGESNSVFPFVKLLSDKGYFVVFTTTTITSANLIKQKLPKNVIHQYSVYFYNKYIKNFYNTWKPQQVFFVESEIFPNAISFLKKQNCKIYLLNARMSNKTYKMWKKVRFYFKNVLKKYDCIFASNEEEMEKFNILSNGQAKIQCFGNLKVETGIINANEIIQTFKDTENKNQDIAKCKLLKQNFENRKIIIFASIHKEEFFHIIWQYLILLKTMNCIGVFVPRYIEDINELQRQLKNSELSSILWNNFCGNIDINTIIIDKFNVLNALYYICDYAVVGGSFVDNIGGHNTLDPISFEKPTLVGNYCCKSQFIINSLLKDNAIIQTNDISNEIIKLEKNFNKKQELINNGKQFLTKNKDAISKIADYLDI